jgi:hypothetical protein
VSYQSAKAGAIQLTTRNGQPPFRSAYSSIPLPQGMLFHSGMPGDLYEGKEYQCPILGKFTVVDMFHSTGGVGDADDISMVILDDRGDYHTCRGSAVYMESWTVAAHQPPRKWDEPEVKKETDKEREMRFFNSSAHDTQSPWWRHWEADGDEW